MKQPVSKSDQVKALREARAARNPVAKEPKAKGGSAATTSGRPSKGSGRLGAGRTAQDRGVKPAVAIKRRPGRPKIEGVRPWEAAGLSKRTFYRRKAEGKL